MRREDGDEMLIIHGALLETETSPEEKRASDEENGHSIDMFNHDGPRCTHTLE